MMMMMMESIYCPSELVCYADIRELYYKMPSLDRALSTM